MNSITMIATAVLVTFSSVSGPPAQQSPAAATMSEQQARKELESVLASRDAAANNSDIERLLSFYASDFAIPLPEDRTLTRQDMEEILRLTMRTESVEHNLSTVIKSIKLRGGEFWLEVESTGTSRERLPNSSIRESRNVESRRETWVKREHGWELRSADLPKTKESLTTIDGKRVDPFTAPTNIPSPQPDPEDRAILRDGYALVFVYRVKDGAIIKVPVYCDESRIAEMTGGSFMKVKLSPGKHTLRSDKGPAIYLNVESGKLYFLVLHLKTGFPKGRGLLEVDATASGAFAYKLPKLLNLRALGSDNIVDPTKVIVERR